MDLALEQAKQAFDLEEVPVGAVLVRGGEVLAVAHNRTYLDFNPAGHAEILCLQIAANILKTTYLEDCDIYVTLEPCPMCAQALSFARIRNVYFGAYDPKGGGIDHGPRIYMHSSAFHKPNVYGGIREKECSDILKDFFKKMR